MQNIVSYMNVQNLETIFDHQHLSSQNFFLKYLENITRHLCMNLRLAKKGKALLGDQDTGGIIASMLGK